MSHRFDSGAAAPSRTLLRQGIVRALGDLLTSEGKYLAAVLELPFAPVFGDQEDEAMLDQLVQGRSPTVAVALGNRQFEGRSTGGLEWSGEVIVHVFIIVKHQRSILSPLTGDAVAVANVTKDPGAETVMDHVFDRLAGTRIQVTPAFRTQLRPSSEECVMGGETWIVWEQVYTANFVRDVNPERDNPNRVTSVQTTHDLRPSPLAADLVSVTELDP